MASPLAPIPGAPPGDVSVAQSSSINGFTMQTPQSADGSKVYSKCFTHLGKSYTLTITFPITVNKDGINMQLTKMTDGLAEFYVATAVDLGLGTEKNSKADVHMKKTVSTIKFNQDGYEKFYTNLIDKKVTTKTKNIAYYEKKIQGIIDNALKNTTGPSVSSITDEDNEKMKKYKLKKEAIETFNEEADEIRKKINQP
ncbi:MAG: hypothetical protein WCF65_04415 [Parachlamydiaceae bacterium]